QVRKREGSQVYEHDKSPDDAGFRAGNQLLIEHAQQVAGDDGVLALAVRPRPSDAEPSITDDFVTVARLHDLTVIDIDPRVRKADMRRAFVAMPFGEKRYKGRKVNCDATFDKVIVPVLEDADLAWSREDRRLDTGIIHVGMIERLGNAHIVVVDTITQNANVFYELGLRHAFADKTTILLGPKGTSPPFDTRSIRHFPYSLAGTAISDQEALEAIRTLQPVFDPDHLEQAGRDSPVFEFFELPVRPPLSRLQLRGGGGEAPRRLAELHTRVDKAADQGDSEELDRLAREIPGLLLHPSEQAQLLLAVGIALREHRQPKRAVEVLSGLAYDPEDGHYELWAQQLAMALRRQGEEALANEGRNPEPLWDKAQGLLDGVLAIDNDPETCGIAGGLAKQRAARALIEGRRELGAAHLEKAARLYLDGIEADPANYYAALNAVSTLRVLAQRLGGSAEQLQLARELLPVALFCARTAVKHDPDDFWAVVSVAELVLTAHLLGGKETEDDVVQAYARAAAVRTKPDQLTSVENQLRLYELVGDAPELINRIRGLFGQRP
ncbi:MAG TPA: tetratricopeptide repeat-containing protein, partial [Actinomycetes bacterium]|nr:tetratricopeptide repeat-containing protein [Actinomycetes bacterium]